MNFLISELKWMAAWTDQVYSRSRSWEGRVRTGYSPTHPPRDPGLSHLILILERKFFLPSILRSNWSSLIITSMHTAKWNPRKVKLRHEKTWKMLSFLTSPIYSYLWLGRAQKNKHVFSVGKLSLLKQTVSTRHGFLAVSDSVGLNWPHFKLCIFWEKKKSP